MLFTKLLPACLATVLLACSPETSLPVIEEVGGQEQTRALEAETLYVVSGRDFRKCAYPMCSGYFIKAVNKTKTTCLDGSKQTECYVSDLDLAALGLSEAQAGSLREVAAAGSVLFSGHIQPLSEQFPEIGRLVATKGFTNRSGAPVEGTIHRVESSGITCVQAPCPNLLARKFNSTVVKQVTDLNLAPLALTDDANAMALEQALSSGLIVAGSLKTKGAKKTFSVTQLFDRVQPEATLCHGDAECGENAYCDLSECLSPCAPGMVCPAVCMGACKAGQAPEPSSASCFDACDSASLDGSCYCDDSCSFYGDCCADYLSECQ
jgi:hypothetical protein